MKNFLKTKDLQSLIYTEQPYDEVEWFDDYRKE